MSFMGNRRGRPRKRKEDDIDDEPQREAANTPDGLIVSTDRTPASSNAPTRLEEIPERFRRPLKPPGKI